MEFQYELKVGKTKMFLKYFTLQNINDELPDPPPPDKTTFKSDDNGGEQKK